MATLATNIRDTSAKRSTRPYRPGQTETKVERFGAARADADLYKLRALPGDDIYFYAKKIDNSRVVRQADPESRGECWSAVGAAAVLLMLGASIIAPHVGSVLAGYKLEALKQERQTLIDQRRDLDVREAALLSPERLHELAQARRLTTPAPDQVIHLDGTQASEGSFAKMQIPAGAARLNAR
jgi:hypothetical protein